jgi:hypothetical protein
MISFLSRRLDFFFFFLSIWIYLWLAETSQQPISQTTWLKVTPHCDHYHDTRQVMPLKHLNIHIPYLTRVGTRKDTQGTV